MNSAPARKLSSLFVDPASRLLVRIGISPNVLTLLGLAIAAASATLLGAGLLAAGGVVLLLAGLLDTLDGAVARATGRASTFGALLDSVVDRVSEAVVLLGLLVYYLDQPHTLGAVLAYVALAGSLLVSYVRARAEGLGIECNVGIMQRPERIAALGLGLIAGECWPPAVLAVLGAISALTAITTVQRVLHVARTQARRD